MPNQRGKNRTFCAFWLDDDFQTSLDRARKIKHMDRSTFIRWAISEELKRLGIAFDEQHVYPPDRAGKKKGKGVRYEAAREHEIALAAEKSPAYNHGAKKTRRHPQQHERRMA